MCNLVATLPDPDGVVTWATMDRSGDLRPAVCDAVEVSGHLKLENVAVCYRKVVIIILK